MKAAREAQGLTQRQLAETSGVGQANISAIEHGRRIPSADTLNRLLVASGFQLCATAGNRTIYCDLPHAGWFPDEDLPPRLPGDPPDEPPALAADAPMGERARVITAVLEAVDAIQRR